MQYIYTLSIRSPYGKSGFTQNGGIETLRDMKALYKFYAADAEMEGKTVVLSVRAVNRQGNILNSCVLRHCDYYKSVPEV